MKSQDSFQVPTILFIGRTSCGKTKACYSLLGRNENPNPTLKTQEFNIDYRDSKLRIIDTPGFEGKLEYTAVLEQILQTLKKEKINLIVYCQVLTDRVAGNIIQNIIDLHNVIGDEFAFKSVQMITMMNKFNQNVKTRMAEQLKANYFDLLEEHGLQIQKKIIFFDENNLESSFYQEIENSTKNSPINVKINFEDLQRLPVSSDLPSELRYFWNLKIESKTMSKDEKEEIKRILSLDNVKWEELKKAIQYYILEKQLNHQTMYKDLSNIIKEEGINNIYYFQGSCKRDLIKRIHENFSFKVEDSLKDIISKRGTLNKKIKLDYSIFPEEKENRLVYEDHIRLLCTALIDVIAIMKFGLPSIGAGCVLAFSPGILFLWSKDKLIQEITDEYYLIAKKQAESNIEKIFNDIKHNITYF